jgi:hypothetical protein
MALVPGITLSAAVALGAMVAPPDPVAVAGPVGMPRRLLSVLWAALHRGRAVAARVQADAPATVREEVLAARRGPGVDPEAAGRVLRRLDLRTVLLD